MTTKKATRGTEKDFQAAADKYAHNSISILKDMIDAHEHAQECNGEAECPKCEGSGKTPTGRDCRKCAGTGKVKCTAGKDSDDPEAWHDEDRAHTRIMEDPLSLQVRGDWHTPGDEDANQPAEYELLLGTGGPAHRIIGELDRGEPTTAVFEYQDWFKPWTRANTTHEEDETLLKYAQAFYFGA